MRLWLIAKVLVAAGLAEQVLGKASSIPDYVPKCWDNSKYVSDCMNAVNCLCQDEAFQNAVFQCLYSQCPTAQFGAALHHALSECPTDIFGGHAAPPLLRHDSINKRTANNHGYNYGSAPAPRPTRRFASASAPAYTRPTRVMRSATIDAYNRMPAQTLTTITAIDY
ncbi:hypothetical protein BJ546DRAFT_109054 [Cryomyces antarcticus]